MGMKFLNKKGWHTGSLRNIENVWKAEQKHDAEQKKLEELRKQIHEERERSEFRLLQEQAGLIPKQERLDFLYESGLAVGKASASDGFKSLESPQPPPDPPASSSTQQQQSVPGALFEVKPQSANDAWRKLHSDPLLLIRQREQEAVARVKNNPIQMAMIRKSVEAKKHKEMSSDVKEHGKKPKKSKHKSGNANAEREREREMNPNHERTKYNDHLNKASSDSEKESSKGTQRRSKPYRESKYKSEITTAKSEDRHGVGRKHDKSVPPKYNQKVSVDSKYARRDREVRSEIKHHNTDTESRHDSHSRHRKNTVKLSEEERAARLREMQMNAELHEEQRWKRLKKAEEDDAREVTQASTAGNKNFLDAVTRSVYGADKGGSSTIEESVRRRMHYSQGRSQVGEGNAFRR